MCEEQIYLEFTKGQILAKASEVLIVSIKEVNQMSFQYFCWESFDSKKFGAVL